MGKAIRFGLAAIKGLGSSATQMIISAREEGGPFRSIYDFAERVDQRAVNKRVLESLIKSGAFDGVAPNRASLMAVLDKAIEYGARAQRDKLSGQTGLFASMTTEVVEEPALPSVAPWSKKESLAFEKEALGFYASGHPLEQFNKYKGLLQSDEVVLVRGRLELSDEGAATIVAQEIHQLERARSIAARAVIIKMPERSVTAKNLASLGEIISRHQGNAAVLLRVETDDGLAVQLRPQQFLRAQASPELTAEIEKLEKDWEIELVVGD